MHPKWTQKQDRELSRLVRRYGTNDWTFLRQQFKSKRTRDSVIKRWHCNLKFVHQKQDEENQRQKERERVIQKDRDKGKGKEKEVEKVRKTQPVIHKDIHREGERRIRSTRSGAAEKRRKIPKYVIRDSLSSNRFLRLRNFLQNKGPRTNRSHKSTIKPPSKALMKEQNSQSQQEQISEKQINPINPVKPLKTVEEYKITWTNTQDQKLRTLVVNQGMTTWQQLADVMGCDAEEIKRRWKKQIYRKIKMGDTVGGFLKYSNAEDTILVTAKRNRLTWPEIMQFLPGRSAYSIEARWRRVGKSQIDAQSSRNRHFMMREFLKKLVHKNRIQKQPVDEMSEVII